MKCDKLPQVLSAADERNSLSVERALRQIRRLLDEGGTDDEVNASIDDVDTMLAAIVRD